MISVIQRIDQAQVTVDDRIVGEAGRGILVLLGIAPEDGVPQVKYLVDKIINLRIFEDEQGKMYKSLLDTGGQLLVVSQFTLLADCTQGRRPSFTQAAPPAHAIPLYEKFVDLAKGYGIRVETGIFGAHMLVSLTNNGPVTFIIETP